MFLLCWCFSGRHSYDRLPIVGLLWSSLIDTNNHMWQASKKTFLFIRPSSDGTYYGMAMSVRPSVRPFSALFSYMLWHNELKFCTWLCFNVLQIKFECRHFASIFEGVMPLCELRIKVMCSFPHFSPTCFDILSWNFANDFVSPYYRSSLSAVNLR